MRFLVLALALAMPLVGWLSNTGLLGPTNGEISNRYPTLIVAAGYAFAIWGPIFLLDVVFGIAQAHVQQAGTRLLRIRVLTAVGFALTSAWMLVFTLQWFWLALAIIWGSLWCLLGAAWLASQTRGHRRGPWWQWLPLSLHAGWVSLVLFALAGLLLLAMVVKLRGNPWYTLAAVWGLLGVHAKQQASALSGADTAANVAMAMAVLVALTALIAALLGQRGARAPRAG